MHPPTDTVVNASPESRARGRAWVWPLGVVGMLCVSLTVCAITVVAAVGDPSYAVEPDYYQRAVDWDKQQAMLATSQALGWNTEFGLDLTSGEIVITLTDSLDRPLEGAVARALVFHHARRNDAQELLLQPSEPGRYAAKVASPREGQWQVRLHVRRGPETYVQTHDFYAVSQRTAASGAP